MTEGQLDDAVPNHQLSEISLLCFAGFERSSSSIRRHKLIVDIASSFSGLKKLGER